MDDDQILTRKSYIPMIWGAIASVGWYLLGTGVILFFASPYIAERYKKWRKKKDEHEYEAKYKKDPDLLQDRLRSVEQARQRMQANYNETVDKAEEKKKAEKEEKMRELLKYSDDAGGNRLGVAGSSNSKSKYNDYNPLMGDSTRSYKPPKRSACRGGGCGGGG